MITFDSIKILLFEWCKNREDQFKYLFPLKGGWEAWVQVDFAAYLFKIDSTYAVLREQQVYINSQNRVDWLFNSNADNKDKIVIELKCQSFDNHLNFIPGVLKDVEKLKQNINNDFKGCKRGVVGIYFEKFVGEWMIENGYNNVFDSTEVRCAIIELAQ